MKNMLMHPRVCAVTLCIALSACFAQGAQARLLSGHGSKHASAVPAALTCGGEVPPPGPNGHVWKCTFDDEFDASTGDPNALNTKLWEPQVTSTSGYTTGQVPDIACYENTPQNISVSGGYLHLTVLRTPRLFSCGGLLITQYTAGMVSTRQSFSQTYGRFEVRAELPAASVPGLQETLWLYPENDREYGSYPASGEVDFAEFYSQIPDWDIPYLHYNYDASTVDAATDTNVNTANCGIDPAVFNDYAVVWEPGQFTITINGQTCLTDDYIPAGPLAAPEPFDQPFFIALTQALGITANVPSSRTPLPATTLIQYVRAWS